MSQNRRIMSMFVVNSGIEVMHQNLESLRYAMRNHAWGGGTDLTMELRQLDGSTTQCGPFHTREELEALVQEIASVVAEAANDMAMELLSR